MKSLFNFKTLLVSLSVIMFISCTNMNAPEMSSTFTAIANDALATPIGEAAIVDADLSINAFIKTAGMQKVGASVTPVDKDDDDDAFPKVSCISEKDAYPREFVIDYGDKGYITRTNVKYTGRIHYIVSDITCKKKEYKYENFSVNDNVVEGSKTVEVLSKGVLRFVSEETTKTAKGEHKTYRYSERKRTKIDSGKGILVGDGDNDSDDYTMYNYSIDIVIKGINAKGEEYSMKTVEPMVTDYTRKGFAKGIMSVTTKKGTKHLDYSKEGSNKEVDYKEKDNNSNNNSDNNNSDNNNSKENNSNNSNSNSNSENSNKN